MYDYCIRLYEDADYEVARDLFATGTLEHMNAAFFHGFSLPQIWLLMLFVFLIPFLTTGSIVLSVFSVTLALFIVWISTRDIFHSYVQHSLSEDLKDIHKYYLKRDGYCFWVAESGGQVVGTVAAHPQGQKRVKLKRLSVAKSHRGRGIAKALCRTVIDFVRSRGFELVTLKTSVVQIDAQQLYKRMGFQIIHAMYVKPYYISKLIDLRDITYHYNIPTHR
ncbi:putative N-acetyltransferase 8B [Discoglossus pictus]